MSINYGLCFVNGKHRVHGFAREAGTWGTKNLAEISIVRFDPGTGASDRALTDDGGFGLSSPWPALMAPMPMIVKERVSVVQERSDESGLQKAPERRREFTLRELRPVSQLRAR